MRDLPESRKEAIAVGSGRYFSRDPCSAGHVGPRYVYGEPSCMLCRAAERTLRPRDLPATSLEASVWGLPHYFTGEPCDRGHVAPRKASTRECVRCAEARAREPARLRLHTSDVRVLIHPDDVPELDRLAQALLWARFPYSSRRLARLGPSPRERRGGIYSFRAHRDDADTLRNFATALAAHRSNP